MHTYTIAPIWSVWYSLYMEKHNKKEGKVSAKGENKMIWMSPQYKMKLRRIARSFEQDMEISCSDSEAIRRMIDLIHDNLKPAR